jgi:UDP-N-acetylmuramoyl-L-alanyl-D-glutamate--2,6-diaminopimelate ligase
MKAISMSLNELLDRAQRSVDPNNVGVLTLTGDGGAMLGGIAYDSHGVTNGALFCCIKGSRFDGHDFAPEAVLGGAAALLVDRDLAINVPQIKVVDVRKTMAMLSAVFYGHPSESLHVIGITGTNGKTTTAHLMAAVLQQHGWATEVFGTLSGARTTPESPDLQRMLAEQVSAGKQAVVMEVSSHALAQDRVLGTRFCASVFTNLSREHLDFHGTAERYFAAKASLFTAELTDVAIINRDDVHGRLLLDAVSIECQSYGASDVSSLMPPNILMIGMVKKLKWQSVENLIS